MGASVKGRTSSSLVMRRLSLGAGTSKPVAIAIDANTLTQALINDRSENDVGIRSCSLRHSFGRFVHFKEA